MLASYVIILIFCFRQHGDKVTSISQGCCSNWGKEWLSGASIDVGFLPLPLVFGLARYSRKGPRTLCEGPVLKAKNHYLQGHLKAGLWWLAWSKGCKLAACRPKQTLGISNLSSVIGKKIWFCCQCLNIRGVTLLSRVQLCDPHGL